jgi:hypothetical protein
MDETSPTAALRQGHRYLVRYRSGSQRNDRTAAMVYLRDDAQTALFDARPAAGTQRLPHASILTSEPVPADTPAHINKVAREARDVGTTTAAVPRAPGESHCRYLPNHIRPTTVHKGAN